VSTINSILANKKNKLQQHVIIQPSRKKLKTSKYEKTEYVLLVWFRKYLEFCILIQGPVLRQKAEKIAIILSIKFTPLNRSLHRFRKCPGLRYRMMNRKNKGVTVEEIGNLEDMSAFSALLTEYNPKAIFNTLQCALFFSLPLDKT
jgi:hypothetical protein